MNFESIVLLGYNSINFFYEQIFELGGVNYAADCGKKEAGLGSSF